MIIENNTVATRKLLGRFCFANMFYRGRNLLVIMPLLIIAVSIVFSKMNEDLLWLVKIVVSLAVAFPIFIVAINVISFNISMRSYPLEGKKARVDFSDEGIFVGGIEKNKRLNIHTFQNVWNSQAFLLCISKRLPQLL